MIKLHDLINNYIKKHGLNINSKALQINIYMQYLKNKTNYRL